MNGEGRLFLQQSANVFLPGGVAGRGGTSDDVKQNSNGIIIIPKDNFNKTIEVPNDSDTDLEDTIIDNENSSVTNINDSTAIFTDNNNNTISITTVDGTNVYDKDDLEISDVDTNAKTGYEEEEEEEDVSERRQEIVTQVEDVGVLPTTGRVGVLPNVNDFSPFIEISTGVTPEREFEIITIVDPGSQIEDDEEEKIIPGSEKTDDDDQDDDEFTRIVDPEDEDIPTETKIDDPGDDDIPPSTPTVFPPVILLPPPEIPPFIPADCGNPPVPRINVPVGEDPDIDIVIETPTTPAGS